MFYQLLQKQTVVSFLNCDPICVTSVLQEDVPDIIDLLSKEGSKLVAFAVGEHFTGNLTWGVCQYLNSSKKSESVV